MGLSENRILWPMVPLILWIPLGRENIFPILKRTWIGGIHLQTNPSTHEISSARFMIFIDISISPWSPSLPPFTTIYHHLPPFTTIFNPFFMLDRSPMDGQILFLRQQRGTPTWRYFAPPEYTWSEELSHAPDKILVIGDHHPKYIPNKKTGWWYTYPLWKIWVRQLGLLFPIYGKIKHVPNHQPV